MKKKDIGILVVTSIFILVAIYFGYKMLFPSKGNPAANTTINSAQTQDKFTGEIDQTTLDQINKLNDYGTATLDNIGRANPFGPLN
ncbi:MAG: hypothetical protein WC437_02890 [Patescibacteria group bacterium]|jgi:hypothetical protein|nr:hypothetical protein [Patescibacteria group bacterium]